jgi:hypothetical protein
MTKIAYTERGASISPCGRYRYKLWREWRMLEPSPRDRWRWFGEKDGAGHELGEPKSFVFVMLNPSTADGDVDDPTIRKCVKFARREKYDRLLVVNLFAWRATSPRELLAVGPNDDPVGYRNQDALNAIEADDLVVCAWGAHGDHLGQNETMLGWLGERRLFCLGKTKDGHPRHPLYLRDDAPLTPFDEGRP